MHGADKLLCLRREEKATAGGLHCNFPGGLGSALCGR